MTALDLVRLTPLMARTAGSAAVPVGLIDGPVATTHPQLSAAHVRELDPSRPMACSRQQSASCRHGTFAAGMLAARRGGGAPAIAPDCPLLVRPLFAEGADGAAGPRSTPEELAKALFECVAAGARVLNVSAALVGSSSRDHRALAAALDEAARRGVLVVASAGNDGAMNATTLTRHPWVIPVASCDASGRPADFSNTAASTARAGVRAPGVRVVSLASDGGLMALTGTSAAAPFVAGAAALLWSEFPAASAGSIRRALAQAPAPRRRCVVPPLLDAWAAYLLLRAA